MIAATTHPKRRFSFLAVVGVVFALLLATLPATQARADANIGFTGKVVLQTGTIAGAGEVDIYYQRLIAANTWGIESFGGTTNASGIYSFGGLDVGNYRLRIDYKGTGPYFDGWYGTGGAAASYANTNAFAANAADVFAHLNYLTTVPDILLSRPGSHTGLVQLDGASADGVVKVTASYYDPTTSTWVEAGSDVADATNSYGIGGLINVGYRLTAEYLGDEPYLTSVYPAGGGTVYPTYSYLPVHFDNRVSGHVYLDDTSVPAPAGSVRVTLRNSGGLLVAQQLVDAAGAYSFTELLRNDYTLDFAYLGSGGPYRTNRQQISLYEAQYTVDQVLEPPSSISGTVRGTGGVPVAGVTVRASASLSLWYNLTDVTDANGNYSFDDLEAGFWDLYFNDGAGPYASVSWNDVNPYYYGDLLEVLPGEDETGIDAQLRREATVTGTVVGSGLVPADYEEMYVEVMIYDYESGSWIGTADTYPVASNGTYAIADLYPDSYRLHAVYFGAKGWRASSSAVFTVAAGEARSVALTLPGSGNPPINVDPPTVAGTSELGDTWSVGTGSWFSISSVAVAWLRCNAPIIENYSTVPAGCVAIPGANGAEYTSTYADGGKYLTAQVAGINPAGATLVGATNELQLESAVAVTFTTPPTVERYSGTWYASHGEFATARPYVSSLAYAWLRCANPIAAPFVSIPAGCTAIPGARDYSYVATAADVGKYLTAQVAASNGGPTVIMGAASTTPVPSLLPSNTSAPTVSGSTTVGSTWTLNPGTWTGSPTFVQAWLRCLSPVTTTFTAVPAGCTAISGARSTAYVTTSADAGMYLTAQVGAVNAHGTTLSGAVSTTPMTGPPPATPPVNTVAPSVSGTTTVGSTWTLNTGTWTGSPTPTIVQAWLRCTASVPATWTVIPAGCVAISGARGLTYVTTSADAGKYLTAQVAGINSQGTTFTGAASTVPIAGPPPATPPVNTVAPTVSGATTIGSTWTLNRGTWTGNPTPTYVQAWLRCNAPVASTWATIPAGCVAISGARGTTYVTTAADAGKYLVAQVGAINSAATVLTGTANTTAMQGPPPSAPPVNTVAPIVSGTAAVGATWTLDVGTWTGSPTPTYVQAWLRCTNPVASTWTGIPAGCVAISGARGLTYVTTSADAGRYLVAQVGAVNSAATVLIGTAGTTQIPGPPPPAAPVNTAAPTVTGAATVGATWTLNVGTWTGNPAPTYVQAWLRCNAPVAAVFTTVPSGCVAISGARSTTYVTTAADAGKYVTAQVGGINSAGTTLSGAISTTAIAVP